jgi:hypothetical protein
MQTRALLDFHELSLNRAMRLYGPIGDLSVVDGKYYPSKAPLLSFAAVPVYWFLKTVGGVRTSVVPEIPLVYFSRLLLTVLPTLASLILIRKFLGAFVNEWISDLVTVTYALGTLAFSYSLLFMSHQTTASLLFAAFFCIWSSSRATRRAPLLVLAGFLAGCAVAAEYTSALCATLLLVYAWLATEQRRKLSATLFVAGAFPALTLLALYHTVTFGGPFESGYRHLADSAYQPWHLGGFLGIRTPSPSALVRSLFSPLRGLFALSPVLLLGILGLRPLWSARGETSGVKAIAVFTSLLVAGYLYFTASFSYESWGWTTGPRHLTGLVPFLLLPLALVTAKAADGSWRGLIAGLVAASVVITSALTMINYIPDDVSDGAFGLFVPLVKTGYLSPAVWNPAGFLNPAAGVVLLLFVLGAAAIVCVDLLRGPRIASQVGACIAILALCIGAHRLAFTDSGADRGALELLKRDWLAPPGFEWRFWSFSGIR